jgi:pilus assembly protein CpaF
MKKEELEELENKVQEASRMELNTAQATDEELRSQIEQLVDRMAGGRYMTIDQRISVVNNVYAEYRGLGGLLDSIMSDDAITEVMINGPKHIFVEKRGELMELDKHFKDEDDLMKVIRLIADRAGREVSQANPILDTRLMDGSRVSIVLPPISLDGATVTIRKFSKDPMTMDKLIGYKSLTPDIAKFLKKLVQARYNIFISGGTGSGKTTFLNALSNYIPREERVITIEDSAELQIVNVPNIVRMETRNATASSGKDTEISMRDLIKSSLRMRPDRIVVGEVRGAEALDMLQAMNTGHDGSLSTGHANSAHDMLSRLETMVLQGAADLPLMAVRQQISSAVDIIVHLSRLRDHSRKTMMITEVLGMDEHGNIQLNPLYEFRETKESTLHHVVGHLVRTDNPMVQTEKLFRAGFNEEDLP